MIPKWLLSACIQFAIRQMAKYGDSVDFHLVLKDFLERIPKLIPGMDPEDVQVISRIFQQLAELPMELNNIRLHLKDGDYYLASESLKYLIVEKLWLD